MNFVQFSTMHRAVDLTIFAEEVVLHDNDAISSWFMIRVMREEKIPMPVWDVRASIGLNLDTIRRRMPYIAVDEWDLTNLSTALNKRNDCRTDMPPLAMAHFGE